jgi:protoporphyrinogen/coproporphyrinogen III oxidase
MRENKSVLVIGAGISGLACAYRLRQRGLDVALLEARGTPGGLIGSTRENGFLLDAGPQSFQLTPSIETLVHELNLESQLQVADAKAPRYVLRGGKLQKIPMSPPALLASGFLSLGSRWKIASEPFRRTRPPSQEESVAAFVRRKFGHEILEYLVSPFVSGVYAGDPERLSLKAAFPTLEEWEREYGSVIRGAKKSRGAETQQDPERKSAAHPSLCSFADGVAALPSALAKALGDKFQPRTKALSLERSSANFAIRTNSGSSIEVRTAGAIVLATPAYAASEILSALAPQLAATLTGIPYAPVAVASAGYHRQQIGHPLDGFGFLVPRSEKIRTLGTVFNSSLFPGRAPEGSVAITSFLGGATDLDIVNFADSEIVRIAHEDNANILQISGAPTITRVQKWHRALPQYNLGHGHIVETIHALEHETAGLFIAGNYLEGPALGKCVDNGFKTADAVASYIDV